MTSTSHFQSVQSASSKFAEYMDAQVSQCRSFAACVRREYARIEQAVSDGVALEAIVQGLSKSYGVQGSLAALKSALSRIRRANDGRECQQWLDNASASTGAGGMPIASAAAAPMVNSQMPPGLGSHLRNSFAGTAPLFHFPSSEQPSPPFGQFPPSVRTSSWPAQFPQQGQFAPPAQPSSWPAQFPQQGQFVPPAQPSGWPAQFSQRAQWPQPIPVVAGGTVGNY